jgi:hypothetical protein
MSTPKPETARHPAAVRQQWLQEAQRTGAGDSYTGRREKRRFTWNAQLEVRVIAESGHAATRLAHARDVSEAGIRFLCKQPISPWTKIEVSGVAESVGVPAVVRHCTSTVNGFFIGADFLD